MFVLLMEGIYEVPLWDGFMCYDTHSRVDEGLSRRPNAVVWDKHTHNKKVTDLINLIFYKKIGLK
jgi:hypothetical protein